ncbi:MAG: glycosyltransferase, partial [Patescibacteria group bacterium]
VFKGQISHQGALKWMRGAEALLFTIRRPEVCPMVVGEALACGTPVIGTCVQPLPEMLRNKKTSFLSDKKSDLIRAIQNIEQFDRRECRKYAQDNFNSVEMAKKYLSLYEKIVNN